jgi:hypothetical protein
MEFTDKQIAFNEAISPVEQNVVQNRRDAVGTTSLRGVLLLEKNTPLQIRHRYCQYLLLFTHNVSKHQSPPLPGDQTPTKEEYLRSHTKEMYSAQHVGAAAVVIVDYPNANGTQTALQV